YEAEDLVVRNYGAFEGAGTPFDAMARTGAGALLLEEFVGRLQPHTPWALQPRECSMLFRGQIVERDAHELLEQAGHRWLDVRDNGVIGRSFDGLSVDEVHAYHLMPRGVDKGTAVAADLVRRGCAREQAIAIGDSPSDAVLADYVAGVFIVANGREHVEAAGPWPNTVVGTEGAHGDGFAEAVLGVLRTL
ncbi:MAG: HAD hydrolase family protein, partial [Candidatus Methylomirabilales bacterium]